MAENKKTTRSGKIAKINREIGGQKDSALKDFRKKIDRLDSAKSNINSAKAGTSWPQSSKLAEEASRVEGDIVDINRDHSAMMRMLELERRQKITELGTSYVPAFEGHVRGSYAGLDSEGNHYATYGGKSYKVISLGSTSIPKGTLVQLWFAGNSYYIDW